MEKELSCNVSIHTEMMNGKKIYLARCEELGMSDFGDTPEEALFNLRKAIRLLIEVEPLKRECLERVKPLMVTRLLI